MMNLFRPPFEHARAPQAASAGAKGRAIDRLNEQPWQRHRGQFFHVIEGIGFRLVLPALALSVSVAPWAGSAAWAQGSMRDDAASAAVVEVVAAVPSGGTLEIRTFAVPAGDADATAEKLSERGWASGVNGPVRTLGEPREPEQWGYRRMSGPELASEKVDGRGVTVAVLDTGVDSRHRELQGKVLPGYDFIADRPMGTSFDDAGHGTHVAGVIAAAHDQSGIAGLAPEVRVLPVKVLDSSGYGDDAGVARGIVWAVDQGADVLNLSLGTHDDNPALRAAVSYAHGKGVLVVASAGNDRDGGPTSFPAAYPEALAVAATTTNDSRAFYSTTGNYVDVAAPGDAILSLFPGDRYMTMSGTSMAAPHVSAAAALVMQARGVGPLQAGARIRETALDLGDEGVDRFFGAGLLNAPAAAGLGFSVTPPQAVPGGPTGPSPTPSLPSLPPIGAPALPELPVPALPPLATPAIPSLPPREVPTPAQPSLPPATLPLPPATGPLPRPQDPTLPPSVLPPSGGTPSLPAPGAGPGLGRTVQLALVALKTGQEWRVQVQVPRAALGSVRRVRLLDEQGVVVLRLKVDPWGVARGEVRGESYGSVTARARGGLRSNSVPLD